MNEMLDKLDLLFLCLGLPAQAMFAGRFFIQWIHSERHGKSIVPVAFWYLSLFGSVGLLIYGIIRGEPILILGHAPNAIIYIRNLMLISKERKTAEPAPAPAAPPDQPGEKSEH